MPTSGGQAHPTLSRPTTEGDPREGHGPDVSTHPLSDQVRRGHPAYTSRRRTMVAVRAVPTVSISDLTPPLRRAQSIDPRSEPSEGYVAVTDFNCLVVRPSFIAMPNVLMSSEYPCPRR